MLHLDYFMKEMGPFSEIFANLESMNRAVSNALVESAKVCSIYCFSIWPLLWSLLSLTCSCLLALNRLVSVYSWSTARHCEIQVFHLENTQQWPWPELRPTQTTWSGFKQANHTPSCLPHTCTSNNLYGILLNNGIEGLTAAERNGPFDLDSHNPWSQSLIC